MALIPHQSWHRCLANRFRPISLEATPTDLYFVRSYFNFSTFEDRRDEDHFLFTDSQLIVLLLIIQTFATDCQNCSVELSLLQTFWRVGGWYNKQIWRTGNHLCREKPSRFLDTTEHTPLGQFFFGTILWQMTSNLGRPSTCKLEGWG